MVSTLFSRGKSLLNSSCVRSNSSSPAGNRSNCWQPREKCGAELKLSLCFVFRVRFWNFLTICTIDSIAKRGRARNVVVVGCRGSRAGYAVPSAERFSASYCIIKMPKREKKEADWLPICSPRSVSFELDCIHHIGHAGFRPMRYRVPCGSAQYIIEIARFFTGSNGRAGVLLDFFSVSLAVPGLMMTDGVSFKNDCCCPKTRLQ